MSRDGYIVCDETRMYLSLGTIVAPSGHECSNQFFHHGNKLTPLNWQQVERNQLLWKFLADHLGHDLYVCSSDELDDDRYEPYSKVGDDGINDVTVDDYLRGWSGLG